MSINRRMNKDDGRHIYSEILLSHKKEQNNAICSNMEGTRDSHIEGSKSGTERQISYNLYVESKKKRYKQTYLQK